MTISDRETEQRIRDLETRLERVEARAERGFEIHQVWTLPPLEDDGSTAEWVATHTTALQVQVVPLPLWGRMKLKRLLISHRSDPTATSVGVGLALYRLRDPHGFERGSPMGAQSRTRVLDLVTQNGVSASSARTTSTDAQRLNLTYPQPVLLDGSVNVYFAAWTVDNILAEVFCPNTLPTSSMMVAFDTDGLATALGSFPATLRVGTEKAGVPCIIARSSLGIRVFGDSVRDA